MNAVVLFGGWHDPWHRPDATSFSKTGYVTNNGTVIYPHRGRIARTSIRAVTRRRHRLIDISNRPHAEQIDAFFMNNVINNILYVTAMQQMGDPNSPFWNSSIKIPILGPISREEHEARWAKSRDALQKGDGIFTLDTKSISSRLIAYLDQGTWSHVGLYVGDGKIVEATTLGVVERSIESYHDPRYRLGVYRLPGASPEQIDSLVSLNRLHVGDRYSYRKALMLGIRLLFGIWSSARARHTTPNMLITQSNYDLIEIV